MVVRLSALCTGHPLPPGRFLVLISVRGWVNSRSTVRLEGLGKLKKIHPIRSRSCNLPACSIVPQPTTLPRAPKRWKCMQKIHNLTGAMKSLLEVCADFWFLSEHCPPWNGNGWHCLAVAILYGLWTNHLKVLPTVTHTGMFFNCSDDLIWGLHSWCATWHAGWTVIFKSWWDCRLVLIIHLIS
jgi:hypothetical protein